jgi:hypothetical protein
MHGQVTSFWHKYGCADFAEYWQTLPDIDFPQLSCIAPVVAAQLIGYGASPIELPPLFTTHALPDEDIE